MAQIDISDGTKPRILVVYYSRTRATRMFGSSISKILLTIKFDFSSKRKILTIEVI